MFLDPSKWPYFLFIFRIELGLSTVIGNDDETDTNICISFMLQENHLKISGQGVSDICHPNHYQSDEKVLRIVISNEFSKPNQTLITSSVMNLANPTKRSWRHEFACFTHTIFCF